MEKSFTVESGLHHVTNYTIRPVVYIVSCNFRQLNKTSFPSSCFSRWKFVAAGNPSMIALSIITRAKTTLVVYLRLRLNFYDVEHTSMGKTLVF
jgi:hypothetical protein